MPMFLRRRPAGFPLPFIPEEASYKRCGTEPLNLRAVQRSKATRASRSMTPIEIAEKFDIWLLAVKARQLCVRRRDHLKPDEKIAFRIEFLAATPMSASYRTHSCSLQQAMHRTSLLV